jgi:arginase family enzyme
VAVDADVLEPGEVSAFMPEPGGLTSPQLESILRRVATEARVLGAGFSGLTFEQSNATSLARFAQALGL